MTLGQSMPREIIKWLQSLDLSFVIKNPKRDISNGFLVAEILSRYYPKDVNMVSYENGTRLATKVDNWEQIFKLCKKKGLNVPKEEIDKVMHCAQGYAIAFLFNMYRLLNKRTIEPLQLPVSRTEPLPAYMRDTAATRLKDNEISRVQDNIERTIRAMDTLGAYHEERRYLKAQEAPTLMRHERRNKMGISPEEQETLRGEELSESVQIVDEVTVKAMTGGDSLLGGTAGGNGGSAGTSAMTGNRAALLKAVGTPKTSAGALTFLPQPALLVKPAADIMRPLVAPIIQSNEELAAVIDMKKDIVVSFMEQCRDGKPEDIIVRVFETLANRSPLLIDTLTKSAQEFWKVWATLCPSLSAFPEGSAVFESAVFLFKRIGDHMRQADPALTQQLMTEVGLPVLGRELSRSPQKREALCDIIYNYTQEDTLNHLLVLRALKDNVSDGNVYTSCLACLITVDAQLGLLDEHLLDLYIYFALIAMQNAQPKIRVAGISILCTVTMCSAQHQAIQTLIPNFAQLASDDYWEVQAQLLLLSAHLLGKITMSRQQEGFLDPMEDVNTEGGDSPHMEDRSQRDEFNGVETDPVEALLGIINRLFVVSHSKNVLQVGLSALVHLLPEFPTLLPMFVSVLLGQPDEMRQRLLEAQETEVPGRNGRVTYVRGNASRTYEEKCISGLWPHLDVAKTFAMQLEAAPLAQLELQHMEVLLASLPERFEDFEADEWLDVFDKVKQYVFAALVDPVLHLHSSQIIKRFWLCNADKITTRSIEASKRTLLQTLRTLYGTVAKEQINEAVVLQFLRDLKNRGGIVAIEVTNLLEAFRETYPTEYESSQLDTVFA